MSEFFGTDGIRQKAERFTPDFIQKIVLGLNKYLVLSRPKKVLIGGDTRESTEWILRYLEESLETVGMEWTNAGVLPTPAINQVFYELGYDLAIDVTASHNAYLDNGIKIFERGEKFGVKLGSMGVKMVEDALKSDQKLQVLAIQNRGELDGSFEEIYLEDLEKYLKNVWEYKNNTGVLSFEGMKIGLDLANGAMSRVGSRLFEKFGAEVHVINNSDAYGRDINNNCGSTHLEELKKLVVDGGLDFGVAFDGDGDRCLMVDRTGEEVDGDQIIVMIAEYLGIKKIATTIMANLGLVNWVKENKIELEITDVGDQNVFTRMQEKEILLGGEQSGHIILPGRAMGDGLLTALIVTQAILAQGTNLHVLANAMKKMPQITTAVEADLEQKKNLKTPKIAKKITDKVEELANQGLKLLIRPSGTEELIRITLWGENFDEIKEKSEEIKEFVKSLQE